MAYANILFLIFRLVAISQSTAPQPSPAITCEFRVFDGGDDISRETRVLVYESGHREKGTRLDAGLRARLLPGLYDVQAIHERDGKVVGIRWMEHLLIVRYPDEEGHHLEVLNFNARYGALELKTPAAADSDATAFPTGDRKRAVGTAVRGAGYLLLVVPAGRYDVRVRGKEAGRVETWLPEMDVPAGRTRLKVLQPPDGEPPGGR